MGRQPCCDKLGVKKGPWTAEEDKKLKPAAEVAVAATQQEAVTCQGNNDEPKNLDDPKNSTDHHEFSPLTENSSTDESRASSESGCSDDDSLMNLIWSEAFLNDLTWNFPASREFGFSSSSSSSSAEENSNNFSSWLLDYQNNIGDIDHHDHSFVFGGFSEFDINTIDMGANF
ncbi:hypothetical protein COLO4_14148 [Corchorus olitorius]|uniref:Uncharacterized protein n=1 Tax=Corchorus olitorius TaxID=93759 RepID=A0A1R3JT82_9ROSI|nr:hypothetical protein COLO4_14148 [Corchorus olitorius]